MTSSGCDYVQIYTYSLDNVKTHAPKPFTTEAALEWCDGSVNCGGYGTRANGEPFEFLMAVDYPPLTSITPVLDAAEIADNLGSLHKVYLKIDSAPEICPASSLSFVTPWSEWSCGYRGYLCGCYERETRWRLQTGDSLFQHEVEVKNECCMSAAPCSYSDEGACDSGFQVVNNNCTAV
ncbi:unnamed protein product [Caenorhabditis auriculariae]|uniref:Uncharacterized protein n=1 Tax=Caenorhabditis auriculariae TaxID=2777116 RepID=A0A8S1HWM2_9PELO|nr:unnamed protein product [Caenorhabditis auriculariae]